MRDICAYCTNTGHVAGCRALKRQLTASKSQRFRRVAPIGGWHIDCFLLRQSMMTAVFRIAEASAGQGEGIKAT
jgi:hypothetical protein